MICPSKTFQIHITSALFWRVSNQKKSDHKLLEICHLKSTQMVFKTRIELSQTTILFWLYPSLQMDHFQVWFIWKQWQSLLKPNQVFVSQYVHYCHIMCLPLVKSKLLFRSSIPNFYTPPWVVFHQYDTIHIISSFTLP